MTKANTKSNIIAKKTVAKRKPRKKKVAIVKCTKPTLASLNGYTPEEWRVRNSIERMCNPEWEFSAFEEFTDENYV